MFVTWLSVGHFCIWLRSMLGDTTVFRILVAQNLSLVYVTLLSLSCSALNVDGLSSSVLQEGVFLLLKFSTSTLVCIRLS